MAVQEVGAYRRAVDIRPRVGGAQWRVVAPTALTGFLDATIGHLVGSAADSPSLTVRIHHDPSEQPPLPGPGTIRWRSADRIVQAFPGARLDLGSDGVDATLYGPDPTATAIRSEVLMRIVMLMTPGLVPIHGAAIGSGGRFWVIPAIGGSGKSTATAVSVMTGLDVLGDDLLLWDPGTNDLHSVFGTLRLLPSSVGLLGEPRLSDAGFEQLWARDDRKAVYRIPRERLCRSGSLAGLLMIGETAPGETPQDALRALTSSMFQVTRVGADPSPAPLIALARSAALRSLSWRSNPDEWGAALAEVCRG